MTATTSGSMTFAQFEQLPETDVRYELRHGELIRLPPPKYQHHKLQRRLRRLLENAAGESGEVDTEWGFRALPQQEYRIADVAFVSREREARISPDGYLEGAPDIVVEVLSASNTASEILDKEQLCLENGCSEFWVVNPIQRTVRVSTSQGRSATYKSGQQIPLPFDGFLAVDQIFT